MRKDKLQDLLLSEMQEIKKDVKEIRQVDIPNLKVEMAVEKERGTRTAKIIATVGGALAISVSTAIAWLK